MDRVHIRHCDPNGRDRGTLVCTVLGFTIETCRASILFLCSYLFLSFLLGEGLCMGLLKLARTIVTLLSNGSVTTDCPR